MNNGHSSDQANEPWSGHSIPFTTLQGTPILSLLQPSHGERILDVGCGNGDLTAKIAAAGALPAGIDFSEDTIRQAKQKYPDINFQVENACDYQTEELFDAVFSHAVLHWIKDAPAVVQSIQLALKTGGRFVAEFAANGNTAILITAVREELDARGYKWEGRNPWYHPTIGEYANLLEQNGFRVSLAQHVDQFTPFKPGARKWLTSFAEYLFSGITPAVQDVIMEAVEKKVQPQLMRDGQWYLDRSRLRVVAVKE
ncbi:class I SAM-dependent methyltransferase [Paenibacillus amylolyticus]|uniref:Trans-aconitate methyltransferase n=1 Tax=Paenibacillus amylolyticus TaxID=1451 RepID=A0A100VKV3_PAEAM|nr:class I SAM-dependent methyltransferase [Paenibacillus amylolyticus]GAS81594.1 trans-aconitate methyltransferase [Paenibacillus amylolyticus]